MNVRVGIVGGTGDIGEGLAMRLSSRHEVVIGSRDEARAVASSQCCTATLRQKGLPCTCEGTTNQQAVDRSDIVILALPFSHVAGTISGLRGFSGKIVNISGQPDRKARLLHVPSPRPRARQH